jgi:hypothetical protein
MRRAAAVLALLALAGCESTQARSARLEKAAKLRQHATGLRITRQSPDVSVVGTTVLKDADGAAAVVELRNRGKTQVDLPIAVSVRDAAHRSLYANDAAGLDASLVTVASLPAGGRLDWVNDQVLLTGTPRDAVAEVGAAPRPGPAKLPELDVSALELTRDPSGSTAVEGTVTNRSAVAQRKLVVYVVARRAGRIVAAGRAVIDKHAPGRSASFSAFPIGDPKGAELSASAPPTVVP